MSRQFWMVICGAYGLVALHSMTYGNRLGFVIAGLLAVHAGIHAQGKGRRSR